MYPRRVTPRKGVRGHFGSTQEKTGIDTPPPVVQLGYSWYGSYGCIVPRRRIVTVKIVLRERESIQEAVRRFRKIVDRSGLKR